MSEINWESWRDYDNYVERAIYRQKAEKEQITIVEKDAGQLSSILFRGEYVASMQEGYSAYLRLGDHRPIINIVSPEGKYAVGFIVTHKGRET